MGADMGLESQGAGDIGGNTAMVITLTIKEVEELFAGFTVSRLLCNGEMLEIKMEEYKENEQ